MKTIVVGIGNPNLRDDAVGLKVAEHFEGVVDTAYLMNTDFKFLDAILNYERVIVVDGVISGAEPGTIIELDSNKTWSEVYASGTHSVSLFEMIRVGHTTFPDEMPKEIKIIGIEVEDIFTLSRECTDKVNLAIPKAVERVKEILQTP
ncbi:MAG: hydrogenase maturation protease [Thermodesulfovibrionales bacterium]|nr:hydrogenase maturation protease [Thermodesulfovibrionales bacterium]